MPSILGHSLEEDGKRGWILHRFQGDIIFGGQRNLSEL